MLSSHPFTPPKLSAYVDEAKTYAAEYTLQTLGIPTDGADTPTTAAAAAAASAAAFPGMEKSRQKWHHVKRVGKPYLVPCTHRGVCEHHLQ